MDIARTPATPVGNPEMADAPHRPAGPPLVRREDYKPFPWRVPEVSLDFRLGLLVYGRLDPDHTPAGIEGPVLDELRVMFPGF